MFRPETERQEWKRLTDCVELPSTDLAESTSNAILWDFSVAFLFPGGAEFLPPKKTKQITSVWGETSSPSPRTISRYFYGSLEFGKGGRFQLKQLNPGQRLRSKFSMESETSSWDFTEKYKLMSTRPEYIQIQMVSRSRDTTLQLDRGIVKKGRRVFIFSTVLAHCCGKGYEIRQMWKEKKRGVGGISKATSVKGSEHLTASQWVKKTQMEKSQSLYASACDLLCSPVLLSSFF